MPDLEPEQPTEVVEPLASSARLEDLVDENGRIKGSPAIDAGPEQ